MHLPYAVRRFNRVVTNRILGRIAWLVPPFAVIGHVGRKSRAWYQTPVIAFRRPGGFIVPLTYGRDVDWLQNMQAAGECQITQCVYTYRLVNPRVVDDARARGELPWFVALLLHLHLPGYVLLDDAGPRR